jgi:hypothetical protein
MSKLNLIVGIAIIATFSILFTNVVIEAFSQTVSNNNTKKDAMGNFINYPNNSSTNNNGNNLSKDYPTNSSI